jgi:fructose-bisphosphate aldolase class I
MLLKPNIVLPESTCPTQVGVGEIAGTTVGCLLSVVLAAVSWSAFPSGCQTAELSSAHLNAMNVRFKSHLPWALAVSFAQATQQPALEIWTGDNTHVLAAQQALYHRAQCHCAGRRGEYTRAVEK